MGGVHELYLAPVVARAALALVQAPRLEELGVVKARHRRGRQPAEVWVRLPLDRAGRKRGQDGTRVPHSHRLGPVVAARATDSAGVEEDTWMGPECSSARRRSA
jgi:hypothetical protein